MKRFLPIVLVFSATMAMPVAQRATSRAPNTTSAPQAPGRSAGAQAAPVTQAPVIPPKPVPTVTIYKRTHDASTYHLADCPFIKSSGMDVAEADYSDASDDTLSACTICKPLTNQGVVESIAAYRKWANNRATIMKSFNDARDARNAAAAKVKADAERVRVEAAAANERVRLATSPVARATLLQAQDAARTAAGAVHNDPSAFAISFRRLIAPAAPEYKGSLPVFISDDIGVVASGPLASFESVAQESVRKFQPVAIAGMTAGVTITIIPRTISSPDIEKVVVQRAGALVPQTSSSLALHELTTRMGAKEMIHSGDVVFPLSAFAPGAPVVLTAVPTSGSNIVKRFTDTELRSIQ